MSTRSEVGRSVLVVSDDQPDVSIVIVNWNTREMLRDCLRSVYESTTTVLFETIVVDNASCDQSVEMIESEFHAVRLIKNNQNRGFGAANNQGMEIARGRYVLLLNSDTLAHKHSIDHSVQFADEHLGAGVVGCRVLNRDGSLQESCFMFPSLLNWALHASYLYKLFPRSRFFGREQMSWWDRVDERQVDVVTGCFMLVRREAIREVGVFDERFFMYAEETDWCLRFAQAGWQRWFTPGGEITHFGGGSAPKYGARRAEVTNRSFVRYAFKHWSKSRATIGVGLITAFYLSRLLGHLPGYLLWPDDRKRSIVSNHWAGLKDIVKFRRHLEGLGSVDGGVREKRPGSEM